MDPCSRVEPPRDAIAPSPVCPQNGSPDRAPGPKPLKTTHAFRPDLEGLRGVAVLLVVLFHAGIERFQGGFIGVDVFFVLSGYLITDLLVLEADRTLKLDFVRFYARRARRLLPAAALVTLVTLLASWLILSPLEMAEVARSARATAAYLSNFRFMFGATDYFAAVSEINPLLHTWSLAVEEQFYLLWPFLVWIGVRGSRSRTRLVTLVLGVTIVSLFGCVWLTHARQPWAFFMSPARAWEFGVGALACLVPSSTLRTHQRFSLALGGAGLIAVCISGFLFTADSVFPGTLALLPVLGTAAVLMAGVGAPDAWVGKFLKVAPLQYLGRLSYSWYLWHWPVLILSAAWLGDLSLPQKLIAVVLSLGFAELAYRLIENPIRFEPRLLSAPASRSLWLGAAITVGCIAAASAMLKLSLLQSERAPYRDLAKLAADRGRIYDDGCMVPITEIKPRECVYGDVHSSTTVVAFGDSHTAQWFPAMEEVARERGWRLVYFTKSGCPSTDVPVFSHVLKRDEVECSAWRGKVLTRIQDLRPSLIILTNTFAYVKRPGTRDARARLTPADWRLGTYRTFSALSSTGALIVLLRDSPRPPFDVPVCLARSARRSWQSRELCDMRRDQVLNSEVFDAELSAAHNFADVSVVDLSSSFCNEVTCRAASSGTVIYRDDSHITSDFARSLAPVLGAALDRTTKGFDPRTEDNQRAQTPPGGA